MRVTDIVWETDDPEDFGLPNHVEIPESIVTAGVAEDEMISYVEEVFNYLSDQYGFLILSCNFRV